MNIKARIYETHKMKNGRRSLVSGSITEWILYGIFKRLVKVIFFCLFFGGYYTYKIVKEKVNFKMFYGENEVSI